MSSSYHNDVLLSLGEMDGNPLVVATPENDVRSVISGDFVALPGEHFSGIPQPLSPVMQSVVIKQNTPLRFTVN